MGVWNKIRNLFSRKMRLLPEYTEQSDMLFTEKSLKNESENFREYLSNMENFGGKSNEIAENTNYIEIKNELLSHIYKEVHQKVQNYNKLLEEKTRPQIPQIGKKKRLEEINGANVFFDKNSVDDEIPDELFIKYFHVYKLDSEITQEVEKYARFFNLQDTQTRTADIKDIIGNPKINDMTYVDAISSLYSETGKKDIPRYMSDIAEYWKNRNSSQMCLYDTTFFKIGTKFDNFSNQSHLTNICLLCRNSGLNDKQLGMPMGFVESLKHVNIRYINTPDDLEFEEEEKLKEERSIKNRIRKITEKERTLIVEPFKLLRNKLMKTNQVKMLSDGKHSIFDKED